jgi:hypothetical protein
MAKTKWPFNDPPDVATITLRQVVEDGEPILHVSHDADDGCWQFLTGATVSMDDAMVVSLQEIFERDSTIAELADLEPGWRAVRKQVGGEWSRSKRSDG